MYSGASKLTNNQSLHSRRRKENARENRHQRDNRQHPDNRNRKKYNRINRLKMYVSFL